MVGIFAVMRSPFRRVASRSVGSTSASSSNAESSETAVRARGHRLLVGVGEVRDQREHVVVDGAVARHLVAEGLEFFAIREAAIPEEVEHLLVAGVPRQVFDGVAAVDEFPRVPVDVAEFGLGHEHTLETLLEFVCHKV